MTGTLLVGGAGFIGTALIRQLGTKDVTVFDSFSPIVHDPASIRAFTELGVDYIAGSVTSAFDLDALMERGAPDSLVYLAAETGTGRSLHNVTLNASVNTLGLAMLLDAMSAREIMPKRIILTSTRAVYGEGPYQGAEGVEYPEQRLAPALEAGQFEFEGLTPLDMAAAKHFPQPVNIYGSTKLSQENILRNWTNAFQIPFYAFRLQNVYGAGQSLTNPYTGVLIYFIKCALQGKPIPIFENGGITRDFVHVDDVASLLAEAIHGRGKPGVYDCGSGNRSDLFDVAATLADISGGPKPELCDTFRLGDVRHANADIAPTTATFDWSNRVALREGLETLTDFVRERVQS